MAESGSQVVINDIPEELKPYRKLLLNAAASQIFTPEYLQRQIPEATFWPGVTQPQMPPPYQPPVAAPPMDSAYMDAMSPWMMPPQETGGQGSLGDAAAMIEQQLEKSNRVGYDSGGLAKAAEEIERLLAGGGDVVLGASGTPLGGYTPPMTVSPRANIPYQIGTGTQPPPAPVPPNVTPPYGVSNGVINTQPSGSLPIRNPNPTPPPMMGGWHPGMAPPTSQQPGSSTMPMFVANKPANFAGADAAKGMGYNPAQYADDSVAQDLARQMGGGVVYTNTGGPIGPPSQAMVNAGGSNMHNAGLIADINKRFADDEGMRNYALQNLRDEIRSYGGSTGGFASGGIAKLADGGFPDIYGTGTHTGTTPTPWGTAPGALNPYVPYGGQRVLGMGDQGQVGAGGLFQASNLTRNSLSGYNAMPSYFNNGEIDAQRDANGKATSPFGIANDLFDTSGNLAINASQNAQDMSWRNPLTSSFGNDLARIAKDPSLFQAGDISLGELTAPQMKDPLGVTANQLTSYQMAGPRFIDDTNGYINPAYMGLSEGDRVNAGQINWGKFTDPGVAEEYTSPYMRQVMDVQKEQARRDFAESKAGRSAQAIKAGAFGGNREAVANSIADRDNQLLMSQIEAQGNQAAFENAQAQYERDRGASMTGQSFNVDARLKGDLANQNLGYNTRFANQNAYMDAATKNQQLGYNTQFANQQALQASNMENLRAALGVQELGSGQSLQAQLANQAAGMRTGEANLGASLATQNLGRTTGLTAAQANQQTRLSQNTTLLDAQSKADQLRQQADQGNVQNQLAALSQQTNSALAGNTIGQNRADLARLAQAMELQRLQQMGVAGQGVDMRTQGAMDLGYQDWTNQQNYPYQQMNWYQSMLAGTPMGYNQEGVQFQKTNPWGQAAGLATAGLGAYGAYQGGR